MQAGAESQAAAESAARAGEQVAELAGWTLADALVAGTDLQSEDGRHERTEQSARLPAGVVPAACTGPVDGGQCAADAQAEVDALAAPGTGTWVAVDIQAQAAPGTPDTGPQPAADSEAAPGTADTQPAVDTQAAAGVE